MILISRQFYILQPIYYIELFYMLQSIGGETVVWRLFSDWPRGLTSLTLHFPPLLMQRLSKNVRPCVLLVTSC